jgi:hypothetical protein
MPKNQIISDESEPAPSFALMQKKQKIKTRLRLLGDRCKAAQSACATPSLKLRSNMLGGARLCVLQTFGQEACARVGKCRGASAINQTAASSRSMAVFRPVRSEPGVHVVTTDNFLAGSVGLAEANHHCPGRGRSRQRRVDWWFDCQFEQPGPERAEGSLAFLPTFWAMPKSRWPVPPEGQRFVPGAREGGPI